MLCYGERHATDQITLLQGTQPHIEDVMPQRGPRTDRRVQDHIRDRAMKGWTAADVAREGPPPELADVWPQSPRTIQHLVQRFRLRAVEPDERWTLTPDEDDPRPILKALKALIENSNGRRWYITVEQARWVAVIARAAPELDGWSLLVNAIGYISAHRQGIDPVGLDHAFAFGHDDGDVHGPLRREFIYAQIPNEIWFPPGPADPLMREGRPSKKTSEAKS